MNNGQLTLSEFIQTCCDSNDKNWHSAWDEFLKRYKNLIYFFILNSCKEWHIKYLKEQINALADDIFSEVISQLLLNLKQFKNRESELMFKSWLQVTCNHMTMRHINILLKNILSKDDDSFFEQYIIQHHSIRQQELYENVVRTLRLHHNKSKFIERDIHIFLLKNWSGFPVKQILKHPFFNNLTPNSIDVIINRMKKNLKNSFFL